MGKVKKIIFVIFNLRSAMGGHSRSLISTYTALKDLGVDLQVINLSDFTSEILNEKTLKNFVQIKNTPIIGVLQRIRDVIKIQPGTVIHCFDEMAYYIVRYSFTFSKIPIILTKCGGPNKYFFPRSKFLICFSKENEMYYKRREKNTFIYNVPNRIVNNYPDLNYCFSKNLKIEPQILCISRITRYYERKIYQSIQLLCELEAYNINARLTIIGHIEDYELYNRIAKDTADLRVSIKTDSQYTQRASQFLPDYDIN